MLINAPGAFSSFAVWLITSTELVAAQCFLTLDDPLVFIYESFGFCGWMAFNESMLLLSLFAIQIIIFTVLYLKLLLHSPRVVEKVALEIENYQLHVKRRYFSTMVF